MAGEGKWPITRESPAEDYAQFSTRRLLTRPERFVYDTLCVPEGCPCPIDLTYLYVAWQRAKLGIPTGLERLQYDADATFFKNGHRFGQASVLLDQHNFGAFADSIVTEWILTVAPIAFGIEPEKST